MAGENETLKKAQEIAKDKVGFIKHLIIYITVMIVLAVINNLTYRGYQWWLWPALWWGVGVFINFLVVYVFRGGFLKRLEDDLIKKEIKKLDDEELNQ
jgi:uncharacterized oligopeptide transporter (OPT) family protein